MFVIIGIVVVFGAVLAGYLMEHGNVKVLMQPAELVIIGGAAIGTVLTANPLHILKDRHALAFVCDSVRMASSGGIEPFDADQMIESDMDVHHQQASLPIAALATMADSLPGLGIVAAVLGVVITMGSLGGPPEEIGQKVAAALVGTFLGILLCYGLVGPIASNMGKIAEEEAAYLHVLRVVMISFLKGSAPIMAVEFARRAIPGHVRPSFKEAEAICRNTASSEAGAPSETAAAASA